MSETDANTPKEKPKLLKDRLQDHIAEYGRLAFIIFLSLGVMSLIGFYIAIKAGIDVGEDAGGTASALAGAWVANKLTMPIRIGATLVLTPIIARILRRPKKSLPES